ncbi:MAG: hypothetical protein H6799_03560 [Candidatus Nomurabacteria bacterium]|nr:MAG: hypothetical protein H6799_03560 [Candidatus Nomurabacteria bacterium]
MAKSDNDLKEYLQVDEAQSNGQNLNEDEVVEDQTNLPNSKNNSGSSKSSKIKDKLHFWSDWSKKKKLYVFGGGGVGVLITVILLLFFVVQPAKANSYIKNSWHDLVSSSSIINREVESEVNLEGTRDLTKELYSFNEKLNSTSFNADSKSSLVYKSSITNEYSDLTKEMAIYFSDSATVLAKTDSDISSISEDDLSKLNSQGEDLKSKVYQFRLQRNLQEEISPNLFDLDTYIEQVKSKKEEIEKEKKEEEQKKKDEEVAAKAKEAADKASVESVGNSYYKAYINGNEAGVKATLSKGYQGEYDYASLTPSRRTNFYPKSYRIVTVEKDGDNYKLTSSVTYISVYPDSNGNNVESIQPVTEIYRVVYSTDTGSWKIDGRAES